MAKNTSSSAFRKIDIDQYNEDNFKEDEAEQSIPTGPDEGEVCALLNQGRYIDALKVVLNNAPLGSSNQQIKDNALALTLKVLLAIKSTQIEEAVGNLSTDDIDVLMKYIYRGFESPSEGSSGHLLLWHEKAFTIGGSGSIVRDNALALTLKVLLAIKSTQIEEAVGNLSTDDIDVLMKYIYRGFESPSEGSSGHLLLWHEKAFTIGGSGSIVRVLSDRMRV